MATKKQPPHEPLRYGVRRTDIRWHYATFRYWTDALDYAKKRQAGIDRDDTVVIVRLVAVRENRNPKGRLLPAGKVVWRGTPATEGFGLCPALGLVANRKGVERRLAKMGRNPDGTTRKEEHADHTAH